MNKKQKRGGPVRSEVRELNPTSNFAALGIIIGSQIYLPLISDGSLHKNKEENRQRFQLLNDFMISNGWTAEPLIPNP